MVADATAASAGRRQMMARPSMGWKLSDELAASFGVGPFVDAENSPSAVAPLQRVEAPVVLRDPARITQPGESILHPRGI